MEKIAITHKDLAVSRKPYEMQHRNTVDSVTAEQ